MPEHSKPANLLYSVDETPPAGLNLLRSLQHAARGLMYMVYPVLFMQEIGATP
jgi:NCS2 family nucleobase:cation symporter-2